MTALGVKEFYELQRDFWATMAAYEYAASRALAKAAEEVGPTAPPEVYVAAVEKWCENYRVGELRAKYLQTRTALLTATREVVIVYFPAGPDKAKVLRTLTAVIEGAPEAEGLADELVRTVGRLRHPADLGGGDGV